MITEYCFQEEERERERERESDDRLWAVAEEKKDSIMTKVSILVGFIYIVEANGK